MEVKIKKQNPKKNSPPVCIEKLAAFTVLETPSLENFLFQVT